MPILPRKNTSLPTKWTNHLQIPDEILVRKIFEKGGGYFHFCRTCWFCVCFTWFGLMNPASWNDEIEIKNFDLLREWRFFEIQTGERGRDGKWTLWLHQNKTQPKSWFSQFTGCIVPGINLITCLFLAAANFIVRLTSCFTRPLPVHSALKGNYSLRPFMALITDNLIFWQLIIKCQIQIY